MERLRKIIPPILYEWFDFTCVKYNIVTNIQLAHFFSQVMHESGDFYYKTENLNYSRSGLLATFPKYFNMENVTGYVRNPKAIANKVYADRMGNGNENSGDGWKYKGRGFIQITGKTNYSKLSKDLGVDFVNNPDQLMSDKYACLSAGWYFGPISSKLNNMSVREVTKYVNGGYNGLEDRQKKYDALIKLLSL